MTIEFVGLPGTGKTTLVDRLANETGISCKRQSTLENNPKTLGYFFLCHPLVAMAVLKSVFRREGTTWKHKLRLFKGVFAAYVPGQPRTFLLDEGLAQRFLSMCEPKRYVRTKAMLWTLPKDVFLVMTVLDEGERQRRIRERGRVGRAGRITDEERKQWQEETERNAEVLEQELRTFSRALVVDTSDLDAAFDTVCKQLNTLGVL